jgi:hypothetical protein
MKRRLLWKFSQKEITNILARMERLKTLLSVALEMDHRQVWHDEHKRSALTFAVSYLKLSKTILPPFGLLFFHYKRALLLSNSQRPLALDVNAFSDQINCFKSSSSSGHDLYRSPNLAA